MLEEQEYQKQVDAPNARSTSPLRAPLSLSREVWCVSGLPIDFLSYDDVFDLLEEVCSNNDQIVICTPNLNFLRRANKEISFLRNLSAADYLVPDGMPVVWLARMLGAPKHERIAGSTLVRKLLGRVNFRELRLFFFGGDDGIAKKAHRVVNATSSSARSVGHLYPGFGTVAELISDEIIEEMNSSDPDVVLVSLPSHKSAGWMANCRHLLNARVLIGSGTTVNFIAGTLARSPKLLQNFGLEWAWRIKEEPFLFKRYAADAAWLLKEVITRLMPAIFIERSLRVLFGGGMSKTECFDSAEGEVVISHQGLADKHSVSGFLDSVEKAYCSGAVRIRLDCKEMKSIDARFAGALMQVARELDRRAVTFSVKRLTRASKLLLKLYRVELEQRNGDKETCFSVTISQ